jgi:diguanylate cyclase (GGDEF)-like protein
MGVAICSPQSAQLSASLDGSFITRADWLLGSRDYAGQERPWGVSNIRHGAGWVQRVTLDLPTLMVMQSFAMASAGAVLLFAWTQNRVVSSLAVWGIADFSAAAGILLLMFAVELEQPALSALGGALLCTQSALIWKAVRNIDGKPAPLVLVFLGAAIIFAAGGLPLFRAYAGSVALASGAVYVAITAMSLWRGRGDRLVARWALFTFATIHALALSVGTLSTFIGTTGQDTIPKLGSLFGFIYFESVVFALGTAVFGLALIKERNEAISLVAARTDALTGVANRAALLGSAERAMQRCSRDGAPIAVVMFDLDRFKRINDLHGHAVGDDVLQKFCAIATSTLRPQDLFGRLGGEEFAAVMPGCGLEAAYVRAERIRAAFVEDSKFIRGRQVKASVSGGVSASEAADEMFDVLLEQADAALYAAKAEGRNRVKRAVNAVPAGEKSNIFRVA